MVRTTGMLLMFVGAAGYLFAGQVVPEIDASTPFTVAVADWQPPPRPESQKPSEIVPTPFGSRLVLNDTPS